MIALSRKSEYAHIVRIVQDDDAHSLFDNARLGDTLHVVEPGEADEIMSQVNQQLLTNQFKRIEL